MNDLISRQAAIEAVADGLKGIFVEYRDIAEKMIGKLPSAQPERMQCNFCSMSVCTLKGRPCSRKVVKE